MCQVLFLTAAKICLGNLLMYQEGNAIPLLDYPNRGHLKYERRDDMLQHTDMLSLPPDTHL
jgi:hypothetical protein